MILHPSVHPSFSAPLSMLHTLILLSFSTLVLSCCLLVLSKLGCHVKWFLSHWKYCPFLWIPLHHHPLHTLPVCLPPACKGHLFFSGKWQLWEQHLESSSSLLWYSVCSCHQQLDSLLAIQALLCISELSFPKRIETQGAADEEKNF